MVTAFANPLETAMRLTTLLAACLLASAPALAQDLDGGQAPQLAASEAPVEAALGAGQDPVAAAMPEAVVSTQLTFRSHSVAAGASAGFLEGQACPGATTMVSGACHPGFTDSVRITNQYPNVGANTWRCGFRNASASTRTVWVYTLCAQ